MNQSIITLQPLLALRLRKAKIGLDFSRFARRYSGNIPPIGGLFSFPPLTEMFYFSGCPPLHKEGAMSFCDIGFPHSEISGSKVARRLPEAYRSLATSFIGSLYQGILHEPLALLS
jgi:hypothetical protein